MSAAAGIPPVTRCSPGFWTKLRRCDKAELVALAEALLLLVLAAPLVRQVPLGRLGGLLSRPVRHAVCDSDRRRQACDLVAWAIDRASRRSPFRAMCIECGVAAQWMLRRRGIDTTLFYGVGLGSAEECGLDAHVWVMDGHHDVLGTPEPGRYAVLATFPPVADGTA